MNIEQRKIIRNNCLRTAYDLFFELKGDEKLSEKNIEDEFENEIYLAAMYLAEKGLLHFRKGNTKGHFYFRITANGIDYIENVIGVEKEEMNF